MKAIRPKSLRSLFVRLLLAQIGFVLALALVFGSLFYVQRNRDVSVLYAQLWAPQLLLALKQAQDPVVTWPSGIHRGPPPGSAYPSLGLALRETALRQALAERGIAVGQMLLNVHGAETTLWLYARLGPSTESPDALTATWLGLDAQHLVPTWSARVLAALLALVLLVVGASWAFTYRLTYRLQALRARMQAHGRSFETPPDLPTSGPVEIASIEAAYADLLARLQQHERERALLLAGVSHDLRSPLSRIRLAAELLPDSHDVAIRRAAIVRNVDNADRLIASFLDFVRAGELPLNETVDLAQIARTAAARFEPAAQALSVQAPDSLVWPDCSALLIDRLISNLIDNALKHGKSPVVVTINQVPGESEVRLMVQDAGMGIPASGADALQEAFARGDSARSTTGTGLGLAIVRQIVRRLDGRIEVAQFPQTSRVGVVLRKLD
jgi:two-component system, OmpR family, osmolarity sensor histidine kinase EnvZ